MIAVADNKPKSKRPGRGRPRKAAGSPKSPYDKTRERARSARLALLLERIPPLRRPANWPRFHRVADEFHKILVGEAMRRFLPEQVRIVEQHLTAALDAALRHDLALSVASSSESTEPPAAATGKPDKPPNVWNFGDEGTIP